MERVKEIYGCDSALATDGGFARLLELLPSLGKTPIVGKSRARLGGLKLRGLRNIAFHVVLCMIALLLVAWRFFGWVGSGRLGRCRRSGGEGVDLKM